MNCQRCGQLMFLRELPLPGRDPTCLFCGWVAYPPEDVLNRMAAPEPDKGKRQRPALLWRKPYGSG